MLTKLPALTFREILREIQTVQDLRNATLMEGGGAESGLNSELDGLRHRKMELENRMGGLQDTRRDLMGQLEHLMRVLRVGARRVREALHFSVLQTTQNTREGSPHSPVSLSGVGGEIRSAFRESTPVSALGTRPFFSPQPSGSLGRGGVLPAGQASAKMGGATLQVDLLSAADSITNTMSTLVKELGTRRPTLLSLFSTSPHFQLGKNWGRVRETIKTSSRMVEDEKQF